MEITKELEAKLRTAENLEDIVKLFAEEGVSVTVEQLKEELARQDKEELTEEDLENANGGIFFALAAACLASAGISMVMRTWRHLRKNWD